MLTMEEGCEIYDIMANHNSNCPHGYEISMEMLISESSKFLESNFKFM